MLTSDSIPKNSPDPKDLANHCEKVVEWMINDRVTPFLGAGINMADRPAGATYEPGKYLPNGSELAKSMASKFNYPWDDKDNLLRVSWYTANQEDSQTLYYYLQGVFNHSYEPTSVHRLLASIPRRLAARGKPNRHQIIVTTNYDDVLERAFEDEKEEFDVLYFEAKRENENAGYFLHVPYKQKAKVISDPVEYSDLPIDTEKGIQRTVIVKIHGALSRVGPESSSFVVTEDDYIDYLARAKMPQLLPKVLEAELRRNRFLFLGYSLKDWNLRVFLRRISQERPLAAKSWAIMHQAEEVEKYFWEKNDVELWQMPLKAYIEELNKHL